MRVPVLAAAATLLLLGACKDDQTITEPTALAGQSIVAARTTSAQSTAGSFFRGLYPRAIKLKRGRDSMFYIVVSRWKKGTKVAWKSSDTTVARVASNGRVTARKAGRATVTATILGTSRSGTVTVTDDDQAPSAPTVASLTLSPTSLRLVRGKQQRITATAKSADKKVVKDPALEWRSSNTRVATVSTSGTVTAVVPGSATITASVGKVRETVAVTVLQQPAAPPPTSGDDGSSSGGTPSSGGENPTPPTDTLPPTGGSWTGGTGALYASYGTTSPHWPQIRTMVTDFRVTWLPAGERAAEYNWMAARFDAILSGDAGEYTRRNPGIRYYIYGLNVTMIRPGQSGGSALATGYADDMKEWYRRNTQYRYEDAFLHEAGTRRDSASRIVSRQGSSRWWPNPADPGFRAYQMDRVTRLVETAGAGGIFWDEHDSGTIGKYLAGRRMAEFRSQADYEAALVELLAAERRTLAARGKGLLINTATYGRPLDWAMMRAAGGAHRERSNYVFNNSLPGTWSGIDRMLSEGLTVEFVTALPLSDAKALPRRGFTRGNSASLWQRAKLFELASYYMVVDRARMDQLFVDFFSGDWSQPFQDAWFRAIEADIGRPQGERREIANSTDRAGQRYTVYGREFERALVLNRPMGGWSATVYDDRTAVQVALPAGETWVPLRADGTLGSPVTSVVLRNAEAAILVKGSALGR